MKNIKLLLGIPTPFDFPLVQSWQDSLPIDRLEIKYYPELEAYKIMRDYFLEHDYTHLVFACSDIVIKPGHIKRLIQDLEEYDYDCISGYMNICLDYIEYYNITDNEVDPKICGFNWYTDNTMPKSDIFEVKWQGFALCCLRRDIVERYEFTGKPGGLDTELCNKLNRDGVKIHCDKRLKLLHLKDFIDKSQDTLVGVKPQTILFTPYMK